MASYTLGLRLHDAASWKVGVEVERCTLNVGPMLVRRVIIGLA